MKLFVSDLDGTLLDAAGKLPRRSRDELNELLDAGLPFTVASARSVHSIAVILDGLRLRLPILEFNGAYLTELDTRRVHFCRSLQTAAALDVVETGHRHGVIPMVSTYDGRGQRFYMTACPANDGVAWYLADRRRARDARLHEVDDPTAGLAERMAAGEQVVCLTFIGLHPALYALQSAIDARWGQRVRTLCFANNYNPGWHWLTVHDALATKAHGLRHLSGHCDVALSEVTVFGDEINDAPMFEAAGRAIAVDNAVPSLRAMADEVIGHHEERSVVRYLQAQRGAARRG